MSNFRSAAADTLNNDRAVQEMASVVHSFESTSDVVSGAIELWAPSIQTFLNIVGPLQYFMAAHYFTLTLKTLGVMQSRGDDARLWKELRVTNAILQSMADGYREVNLPGIVQNITESSTIYDEPTKTIKSFFFYSKNKMAAQQLRSKGYFAYDSVKELFEKVYIWNAFADAASAADRALCKFNKRRTLIHFLDPYLSPKVLLSHMEFTKIHQNVTVVNHHGARQHLTLESVKVHEGCTLTLQHVTVCKIDATKGGKATLQQCDVGWNQHSQSPIPFLFGGKPDKFNNPYNVCGTVFCCECTTYNPSKYQKEWKNWKQIFKRPDVKYASYPAEESSTIQDTTKFTIERTITNVSDEDWYVIFQPSVGVVRCNGPAYTFVYCPKMCDRCRPLHALPRGGSITFTITPEMGGGGFHSPFSKQPISGTLVFMDKNGKEYRHAYQHKGRSDITDFTIVCPTIEGDERVADASSRSWGSEFLRSENTKSQNSFGTEKSKNSSGTFHSDKEKEDKNSDSGVDSDEKRNTILVVGRFGSGKSTLLNTIAGVYWKVNLNESGNREFVVNQEWTERFKTSKQVKGCTVSAVAEHVTTFDGRELTVIDTVGYDDSVNAESFYKATNLTEVMDQYKVISAVVIVVNAQDPRFTRGFVESLACVPTSFKAKVQKNIVLVFTKWNEDDEVEHGDEFHRGFTEQVKIIRSVLGFNDEDELKAYWVDNRPFKIYEKARRTIDNLSNFLDHVAAVPRLSCQEFKEMRALSQYERFVREEIREFFLPSDRIEEKLSGFEILLFKCARKRAEDLKKLTLTRFTAKAWAEELVELMEKDIKDQLPKEVQRICSDVAAIKVKQILVTRSDLDSDYARDSPGRHVAQGVIHGGFWSIIAAAPMSCGASLFALPGCYLLAFALTKKWSREDVIKSVVFAISEKHGNNFSQEITAQFMSYVDKKVDELHEFFNSL